MFTLKLLIQQSCLYKPSIQPTSASLKQLKPPYFFLGNFQEEEKGVRALRVKYCTVKGLTVA